MYDTVFFQSYDLSLLFPLFTDDHEDIVPFSQDDTCSKFPVVWSQCHNVKGCRQSDEEMAWLTVGLRVVIQIRKGIMWKCSQCTECEWHLTNTNSSEYKPFTYVLWFTLSYFFTHAGTQCFLIVIYQSSSPWCLNTIGFTIADISYSWPISPWTNGWHLADDIFKCIFLN